MESYKKTILLTTSICFSSTVPEMIVFPFSHSKLFVLTHFSNSQLILNIQKNKLSAGRAIFFLVFTSWAISFVKNLLSFIFPAGHSFF